LAKLHDKLTGFSDAEYSVIMADFALFIVTYHSVAHRGTRRRDAKSFSNSIVETKSIDLIAPGNALRIAYFSMSRFSTVRYLVSFSFINLNAIQVIIDD